jgi:hypothetical protein
MVRIEKPPLPNVASNAPVVLFHAVSALTTRRRAAAASETTPHPRLRRRFANIDEWAQLYLLNDETPQRQTRTPARQTQTWR